MVNLFLCYRDVIQSVKLYICFSPFFPKLPPRHSIYRKVLCLRGFPGGSAVVKNPPSMQETWVSTSPGWEDPQEKGTATHSSILAWRIPWTV